MASLPLLVRDLGLRPYEETLAAMKAFTDNREEGTLDEFWLLEHPPVFTLGQAGKPEHLLAPSDTPVIPTDRGGQVTWHGPGQLVVYLLLDLKPAGLGVRGLVTGIEQGIIRYLANQGIEAQCRKGAPGVYVEGAKVAALGLRIRKGRSYHGLSLNISNDLSPFSCINPCGYPGLAVTSLRALGIATSLAAAKKELPPLLAAELGYNIAAPPEAAEPQQKEVN